MNDKLRVGFKYDIRVFRPDGTEDESQREIGVHNLAPTEGLNHILDVVFKNGANFATWYIGLFSGNYTPVAGDTMATFPGAATEITAQYDESTRQEWVEGVIASGALDNVGTEAVFTFNADVTVRGGFMGSSSAKGATTGILISAVKFASPKAMTDGATLTVTAGFTLISA